MVVGQQLASIQRAVYGYSRFAHRENIEETLDKIKSILHGKSTQQNDKAKARTTNNGTRQDPFKNVSISDVLGAHYHDFHSDGSQMAGPNPYGSHTNKNEHCLVVESGTRNSTASNASKAAEYPDLSPSRRE